jgi:hypothetical protein
VNRKDFDPLVSKYAPTSKQLRKNNNNAVPKARMQQGSFVVEQAQERRAQQSANDVRAIRQLNQRSSEGADSGEEEQDYYFDE